MGRGRIAVLVVAALLATPAATAAVTDPASTIDGALSDHGERSITYLGTLTDRADLADAGLGSEGWWFAQFGSPSPVSGAPTGDNVADALPLWVTAFNHTEHPANPGCTEPGALPRGCVPTYNFRTFSQDGPARSAGGHPGWARLQLPDGTCGIAGAIVDPHTFAGAQEFPDPTGVVFPPGDEPEPNSNNTVNRVQLQDGTPTSFVIGVVTDTTANQHDPALVEVRGNVGLLDLREELADSQIEPDRKPGADELTANGTPDVHAFRVDGFASGDYLKIRLKGQTSAASFAGIVFDERFAPEPAVPAHPGRGKGHTIGKGHHRGHRHGGGCAD